MSSLNVVVIQMDVKLGNPEVNLANMEKLVRQAAQKNPDIVVLPETWNTGFFPDDVAVQAKQSGQKAFATMSMLAKELQLFLVGGSVSNIQNGGVFNTAKVFDREGQEIASYNKIHLFSPGKENEFYAEGDKVVTFEIEGHKCGLVICYDLRFPELVRRQALDGIEVLFAPSEWPHPRLDHWRTLQKARAIENQIFVISCNGVGLGKGIKFCGHSAMLNPWGEIIQEAEEEEVIMHANIDFELIDDVRKRIPVFVDRRYQCYQID